MTGEVGPMTLTFPTTLPGPRPQSAPLKFYIWSAEIVVPLRVIIIPVFHTCTHTSLEIVFQEQSYSSLHSGRSLAWDHFCGDIADSYGVIPNFCSIIADPCSVIADPCGVVLIPETSQSLWQLVAQLAKHRKTLVNLVKHPETLVTHCETETHKTLWWCEPVTTWKISWTTNKTSWNTLKILQNIMKHSPFAASVSTPHARSFWRYRRLQCWTRVGDGGSRNDHLANN